MNPEIAPLGTSRHFREWGLAKPVTQTAFGKLCHPKASQYWVSQFDNAKFRLSRDAAKRVAVAILKLLDLEDSPQNQSEALRKAWQFWLTNAQHYGNEEIRQYARQLQGTVLRDLPGLDDCPLFDPTQNPDLKSEVRCEVIAPAPAKARLA